MFPISAVNAASRRALARQVLTQGQKRGMALGGAKGPPPKWEGLDKVVRTYLPEDHQGESSGKAILFLVKDDVHLTLI